MNIVYKFETNGGFLAGDTESTFTSYAYPTSEHALKARKNPVKVAREMIANELKSMMLRSDYDVNNWAKIRAK